jgi:hypothetical protein
MPPTTAEAAVALSSARREKLIDLSLELLVVVSRDQPRHSRRCPLIAACVAGGNIGFQPRRKMPSSDALEPLGNRARPDQPQQDFELNI